MDQNALDALYRIRDILESGNTGAAVDNGLGNFGDWFRRMYEAVMSMHQRGFLPIREGAVGGDLTWFQEQSETALEPVMRAITAAPAGGPIDYARLVAAQAASPDYMRALGEAVAAATDRRARDGDPATGPTT